MLRTAKVPAYRLHKATGQAVVTLKGRQVYLGRHDTPQSQQRYHQICADLLAGVSEGATVAEVLLEYRQHAATYYRKDGKPTSEVWLISKACEIAEQGHGRLPAASFDVLALRTTRDAIIEAGYCRTQVNKLTARLVRAFRWATTQKLYPGNVLAELQALPGLRKGRTHAAERPPVLPVEDSIYEATVPHLPQVVADMARLQRATGMRPGEVVRVRPCDIDRSADVWIYTPESHKTEHHGRHRVILIGPRGQAILTPYLLRPDDEYCFRSDRASAVPRNRRRYRRDTYRTAVRRGAEKAFPLPDGEDEAAWSRRHWWHPNQLRHAFATEARRLYGLEAAQVLLGHASANITQVYAERDLAKGTEAAAAIG